MTDTRPIVITARSLFDGTGAVTVRDVAVLIIGERIAEVGPRASIRVPDEAEVIDLGERVLLPGLIDAHTHFYTAGMDNVVMRSVEPAARKLIRGVIGAADMLHAGFTGTRDLGNRDSVHIKRAIEEGEIPGPRMMVARMIITQTGGSPDPYWLPLDQVRATDYRCRIADGVEEVRLAAREQIREGADFLKIMTSGGAGSRTSLADTYHYSLAEISVVVEEGHKNGMRVAAHALGGPAILNAVRAGVDSIEHGHHASDASLDLMKEHDVVFVPTLSVVKLFATAFAGQQGTERARDAYESARLVVRAAKARGVRIAAGTDYGGFKINRLGAGNVIEVEELVSAGLTPAEALVAATKRGAEAMAMDSDIGTVEKGKLADLIATDADPLADISALRKVSFVMKGGSIVRDENAGKSATKNAAINGQRGSR